MTSFPQIRSLADLLPAIRDRKDIIVSEKDGYVSVFYVIHGSDTFDDTTNGRLRRECRGLIFDTEGQLLARPFQKFFNVGEKPETLPEHIDLSRTHVLQEKLDGTLIFPFVLNGELQLATKAGITDEARTAMGVLRAVDPHGTRRRWLRACVDAGRTPCLEHIGDDPRRVLRYPEPELVLLAVRDRQSGAYVEPHAPYPGPVVAEHGAIAGGIRRYIERVRGETGREGDVLVFEDGSRVKFKSDWYAHIHQVMDQADHPRHVAAATLDRTLDDMLGVVPEKVRDTVREISERFADGYARKLGDIETALQRMDAWIEESLQRQQAPEKNVALHFASRLARRPDSQFLFAHLKGMDVREVFDRAVRKHLTRDSRYVELIAWFDEPMLAPTAPATDPKLGV